jgi:hypothetical protein
MMVVWPQRVECEAHSEYGWFQFMFESVFHPQREGASREQAIWTSHPKVSRKVEGDFFLQNTWVGSPREIIGIFIFSLFKINIY